jgi:hypothetical protein
MTQRGETVQSFGKLVLTLADGRAQEFELAKSSITLGRATTNDIALADAKISRVHARVECDRAGCVITDLGSANGTRVNGATVERATLAPGDWELWLYIGDKVAQKGAYTIEKAKPGAASFGITRFAEGVQDGKPVNPHPPMDNFKAGTTRVYAFFDATNLTKQTNWKWQWYHDDKLLENVGGAGVWKGEQTEKDWWLRIFNDKGLTFGTYELKLYIEDKLVQLGTQVIEQ